MNLTNPGGGPSAARLALNIGAFQVGWFATVLGAAHGFPWLGPLVVLGVIALHLRQASVPRAEAGLLLAAAWIGVALEHAFLYTGIIQYPGDPKWVPLWMLTLWPLFATTLNISLTWFKDRLWLAALAGGIAGPLAYIAGAALGAIQLAHLGEALFIMGTGWAMAFPGLMALSRYSDGIQPRGMRP